MRSTLVSIPCDESNPWGEGEGSFPFFSNGLQKKKSATNSLGNQIYNSLK